MNIIANFSKTIHQPKFIFTIFFIVLFGPVLIAYALFHRGGSGDYPFHLNNHGDLIKPPYNINTLYFYDLNKKENFSGQMLSGKWWLMYIGPSKCQQTCHSILYNMRQIRQALGRDASRVERLFIAHPDCSISVCEDYLNETYPEMRKVQLTSNDFAMTFGISQKAEREMVGELYLVDPRGYVMMHYSADLEPRAILSDLKRLLKTSKIG